MQRDQSIQCLKNESFDLLVIGGGSTGAGIALDAQTRGLKVALVEQGDFTCGTSSRSTKLVHGGVRYLEQAVMHLDRSQFRLVREALRERKVLSQIAPHLVTWLPLLIPMYRRWEAAYYNAGLRMYDWLAGKNLVHRSRFVSHREALELCPFLKKGGLKGGVIYYDGQFDDSRMGLSILLTAGKRGAVISNYTQVTGFVKSAGKITGVQLQDGLTGEVWTTQAAMVVNATGPHTDSLRKMDFPDCKPLLRVSSGAHLVTSLPHPEPKVGVLIPKTQDKRVLFVLPWLGHLLIGTTDNPAQISSDPKATPQEVSFIQKEYSRYFDGALDESQIESSWSGLRPLVDEAAQKGTASLSRDHSFDESPSGLLSVFGGKWTTYRVMAKDTVDKLVERSPKTLGPCITNKVKLLGADSFDPGLSQLMTEQGFEPKTVEHLLRAYGDQSPKVIQLAQGELKERLHPKHPMLLAEVLYSVKNERVCRSSDILFRRTRLAFLDKKAALEVFPKVQSVLAKELEWDEKEKEADRLDFTSQL
ncbi:MAG: FAD-dependent oxidoreductase [Proteobacteria bacterium]|nr:FAD-dependent oxidoreductase [Pseudomonadota bacterium]